jgi:hypothetical protein
MSRQKTVGTLGLAALAVWASVTFSLRAQPPQPQRQVDAPNAPGRPCVQEALTRPFHFTFAKPTPIEEVANQLAKALNAPVALDRAALDRLDVRPDDTVQLELDGVRLKTGLKLLLDQLDLTFRVESEDNLLVITDETGAEDPVNRVLSEIKSLHRDVHDIQDAIDELRSAMGLDDEGGPKMRKPTIIEELPQPPGGEKPKEKAPAASPPRSRPGV